MIEILMPVYNGEKYLAEQIDSILSQSHTEWILKIRNDGSTDNSQTIIEQYCKKYPDKIICIKNPIENVGLIKSLNILLKDSTGDYLMFSDQDDIWLKNKIADTLMEIKKIEQKYPNLPAMVCTDATCIDENKKIVAKSFFESQRFIKNVIGDKHKMLALNEVQGCTIMINKVSVPYIHPFPSDLIKIHDMWVGVIIAHFGHVSYLHKQTLLYRQHTNNTVGAQKVNYKYYLHRIKIAYPTLQKRLMQFKRLPFQPNIAKWFFYKIIFAIKRIL